MITSRVFGENGNRVSQVLLPGTPAGMPFVVCPLTWANSALAPASAIFDVYRIAYERAQANLRPSAFRLAQWLSSN